MTSASGHRPPFDIAILGLGIVSGHHLTVEAQQVMQRSAHVYLLNSGYGSIDHLRRLCPEVIPLDEFYQVGQPRRSSYRKMAGVVVAAAMEDPPVTFATYGHPRIFCYPATLIQRAARLFDLRMLTLAAVSALDALLIDVDYDFSSHGLQMYDATDLLVKQRPLQPDVACVLWQCTWIAEPLYRRGRVTASAFMDLQDYLLRYYPPQHQAQAVFSRPHPALDTKIEHHPIGNLAEGLATGSQSGTLFIPPLQTRPTANTDLLIRLR